MGFGSKWAGIGRLKEPIKSITMGTVSNLRMREYSNQDAERNFWLPVELRDGASKKWKLQNEGVQGGH